LDVKAGAKKAEPAPALHLWGDALYESTRTRRRAEVTCAR